MIKELVDAIVEMYSLEGKGVLELIEQAQEVLKSAKGYCNTLQEVQG